MAAAHSSRTDPTSAARDIAEGLAGISPKLVLYFASSGYEPAAIAGAVQDALGQGTLVVGCTTAGELTQGKMLDGSVAAKAFDADTLASAHVAVVEVPSSAAAVRAALGELASAVGADGAAALDTTRYVGLVLHDGMSGTEESVMSTVSSATNVPFVGGSAGDDLQFQRTHVFARGAAQSGVALLLLLETERPYEILRTQSFDVLDEKLTVTRADESTRTIHERDGKPAADAYAAALNVSPDALANEFMRHPLGLVLPNGEPFVRSPRELQGSSVAFYCNVKEGMELSVLRSRDIVDDTRRDLSRKVEEIGDCQGILNFHCILRTLELKDKGQCDAYGALFSDRPTVGFSTYGESYVGHINQTSTMVLFR